MNAGGAPNTCKSNGTPLRGEASGERLSNTWRTCPLLGNSRGKPRVMPDDPGTAHAAPGKAQAGRLMRWLRHGGIVPPHLASIVYGWDYQGI